MQRICMSLCLILVPESVSAISTSVRPFRFVGTGCMLLAWKFDRIGPELLRTGDLPDLFEGVKFPGLFWATVTFKETIDPRSHDSELSRTFS